MAWVEGDIQDNAHTSEAGRNTLDTPAACAPPFHRQVPPHTWEGKEVLRIHHPVVEVLVDMAGKETHLGDTPALVVVAVGLVKRPDWLVARLRLRRCSLHDLFLQPHFSSQYRTCWTSDQHCNPSSEEYPNTNTQESATLSQ